MEDVFSYGWSGIKKFVKQNHVSILYTLIFHLVVLIILIFVKVEGLKKDHELGIKLEFEEKTIEEILAEEAVEIPAEWIEQIMQQREISSNRAVNLNAEDEFSEDISTDEYVQDLLDQIEQKVERALETGQFDGVCFAGAEILQFRWQVVEGPDRRSLAVAHRGCCCRGRCGPVSRCKIVSEGSDHGLAPSKRPYPTG